MFSSEASCKYIMMKKRMTVFTPTYNRAYILPKLYDSLCQQTVKSFEWIDCG